MTESCVFRRAPKFKRFGIFQWDEFPVPAGIEMYCPGSHRGVDGNVRLYRERPDLSSWALVGDGNTRRYELGTGWDCALHISLADGHQCWTRQRPVSDSMLRTWTTINGPGMDRTLVYTGSFAVTPCGIRGGSIQMGQLQILRSEHGLSISLENRELGVRREWRLDQPSQRKMRIWDLQDPNTSRPFIIASSDSPVSLRKTIRWLILELTGLVVADEIFSRNAATGIEIDQPVTHPAPVVAVTG